MQIISSEELIYQEVSEIELYEYYIGIDPEMYLFKRIPCPYRVDNHFSFSFFVKSGHILWKDFTLAKGGNVFSLVAFLFEIDYSSALLKVDQDFNLNLFQTNRVFEKKEFEKKIIEYKKVEKIIEIKKRDFNEFDFEYWKQFNINEKILLHHNVHACKYVFINGNIVYTNKYKKPAYAYKIKDKFKIYQPFNPDYKFLNNYENEIEGYEQLAFKLDFCIITKAKKDVMTLDSMEYESISSRAEGIILSEKEVAKLYEKYKLLVIFMDNDSAGNNAAQKYKKLYNLDSIQIPIESGCKDISDYMKMYGLVETKELMKRLLNQNKKIYESRNVISAA